MHQTVMMEIMGLMGIMNIVVISSFLISFIGVKKINGIF